MQYVTFTESYSWENMGISTHSNQLIVLYRLREENSGDVALRLAEFVYKFIVLNRSNYGLCLQS